MYNGLLPRRILSIKANQMLMQTTQSEVDFAKTSLTLANKLAKNRQISGVQDNKYYQAFSHNKIRGYLIVDKESKAICLCFVSNWFCDFKFKKISSPFSSIKGKIHQSFYQTYIDCLPKLNTTYNQITCQFPNYTLIVTGQQLGAPLAIFHSINLISFGIRFSLLVFSTPKFGDILFNVGYLKLLRQKSVAFYKEKDDCNLITHFPPSIFGFESLYYYS